ncbi:MAG TPA: glycosyltransferase [Xanthomonadaceae bacterium]|nr:glycosyltransferase [Xanthomonadaceae bacterium]
MADASAPLVALFLPQLAVGGAERVLLAMAGEFAGRGYRCDLVTAQDGGRWVGRVPAGVRHVSFGKAKPLHAVPSLVGYLRRERPAALLASVFAANIAAALACGLAGTRCILREASQAEEDARSTTRPGAFANRLALRVLYRRADAIVALTPGLAAHIARAARVPRDNVTVIPNPYLPSPEAGAAVAREADLVLACGRLEPQKDFDTLLRAFALVRREREARLVILGEGSAREALERHAQALGLEGTVTFAGYAADVHRWMRRATVLASTSRTEGFPNVLVEALGNGCRVVSTLASDAVAELLADGARGSIAPVGDADAVARGILAALSAPPVQPPAVAEKYDLAGIVDRYLALLLPTGPRAAHADDRGRARPGAVPTPRSQR